MFQINAYASIIYLKSFKIIFIHDFLRSDKTLTKIINKLKIINCRNIVICANGETEN